ncbi:hypothetical protein RDV78_03930 [Bacillota bacterium LX-D]|nr:hypothetical protein [Bacillota bacterium LX-D]
MLKKKWLLSITFLCLFAGAFLLGQKVQADENVAAKDPIAAKSYVTEATSKKILNLQQQIAALKNRIQELQQKIK